MARGGEGQIAGNAKGGCSVLVVSGRPGGCDPQDVIAGLRSGGGQIAGKHEARAGDLSQLIGGLNVPNGHP